MNVGEKLQEKHKWFVNDLTPYMTKQEVSNFVYCECDDGWYTLLDSLLCDLEVYFKEHNLEMSQLIVTQVKEKYGELCFYVGFEDISRIHVTWILDKISEYENKSRNICELCGSEGELVDKKGWLKTLCLEHKNDFLK